MIKEVTDIQLTEPQRIWLRECYKNIYCSYIDPKLLKVTLHGSLPPKFYEYGIDSRLISGTSLTLLGIMCIEPENPFGEQINKIILHVKEMILDTPSAQAVTAESVGERLGIAQRDVELCFKLMETVGRFFDSGNVVSNMRGYSTILINSEEAFDEYLAYENLEEHIQTYLRDWDSKNKKLMDDLGIASYQQQVAQPAINIKPNTAFIIMAIDPSKTEAEDACRAIKEVFHTYGIAAVRADEIEHQDKITDVILERIESSEFLISDLSGERPNVYYELGYAHAINKRPILFRQKGTKVHFDLAGYNIPEYNGVYDLKEKLANRLEEMTGKVPSKK